MPSALCVQRRIANWTMLTAFFRSFTGWRHQGVPWVPPCPVELLADAPGEGNGGCQALVGVRGDAGVELDIDHVGCRSGGGSRTDSGTALNVVLAKVARL